jgi:hypothetical protein
LAEAATKEARKPVLIRELKKLTIPSHNIYLSTNPDIKIHGIIPEASTVLQSATRVKNRAL